MSDIPGCVRWLDTHKDSRLFGDRYGNHWFLTIFITFPIARIIRWDNDGFLLIQAAAITVYAVCLLRYTIHLLISIRDSYRCSPDSLGRWLAWMLVVFGIFKVFGTDWNLSIFLTIMVMIVTQMILYVRGVRP